MVLLFVGYNKKGYLQGIMKYVFVEVRKGVFVGVREVVFVRARKGVFAGDKGKDMCRG